MTISTLAIYNPGIPETCLEVIVKILRIGIDAHVVTGRHQGTRTMLISLLKAIASKQRDHDFVVYTDDPDEASKTVGSENFNFRNLGGAGSISRLISVFPRMFKEDRINVGVFQYNTPIFSRAKHVVYIHDILPITHKRYFPFINRWRIWVFFSLSILRSSLVVTVSHYTRNSILNYYKINPSKIVTIYNGPSFPREIYQGPRMIGQSPYILAVGRIEARKNIPLLIEAFAKAKIENLRLIVVGSLDLGFNYKFPNNVSVENRANVDDDQLIELYRGASLFVFPSAAEGFGIPLLDALLFGIPTISSDQTAMSEIGAGVACMFDPTTPDAVDVLAQRISGHFGDAPVPEPSIYQRNLLAERFNWDGAAEQLIRAIENIGN